MNLLLLKSKSKNMKRLLSITLIVALSLNLYSQEYDVRKVKWGMNHKKVSKIEKQNGNKMLYFQNAPLPSFLSCSDCFMLGDYSTRLTYEFTPETNKLFKASIEVFYGGLTEEKATFEFIYALFQEKYESPGEKHFTGDLLPDGSHAENVFYLWENDKTFIVFEHPFIGLKSFVIWYLSKEWYNTALEETGKTESYKKPPQSSHGDANEVKKKKALDEL